MLLFFADTAFAETGSSKASRIIKSGCEDGYQPFLFRDKNGEAAGFSVELLDAALNSMGYKAEFASGTWDEQKNRLANREIEIYPMAGKNEEREKIFDFSVPYLTFYGAIIVRKENKDVKSLQDLKGKKLAFIKSDLAEEYFIKNYPDFEYITAPVFIDAVRMLEENRCDAIIAHKMLAQIVIAENNIETIRIVEKPLEEIKQEFCFAVPEDSKELLAIANEGLAKVTADGTYRQLHAKWFAGLQLPENRKIIIGGSYDYPPYEFIDENGQPAGYNVDITKAVFSSIGLDYEIHLGPWKEIVKKLENGQIDAIQGMLFSVSREEKFDFSTPHSINTGVIVSNRTSNLAVSSMESLKDLKTAVQDSDILHEFALKKGLPSDKLMVVPSQEEALLKVNSSAADCALVARLSALYWIKNKNLSNLKISETEMVANDYCFSVLNNNRPLMAKINEGLKLIEDNGVFRDIQIKWFGIESQPTGGLKEALKYIVLVTIPLFTAILVFLAWNWSLRHEVANRTAELKKSETLFRSLIESAPYAIFVQTDNRFAFLNPEALKLFGCNSQDEIIGQSVISKFHESSHEEIRKRISLLNYSRVKVSPMELKALKTDGSIIEVETSATPIEFNGKNGALVFARDLSENKKLEEQLRQSQKMDAIGQLAGGIAHDYNNMLSVIMGYSELAMSYTEADSKAMEYLDEVIKAARKSGEITSQLLTFARKQEISPEPVNLKQAVEESLKMLRRLIGENIQLTWNPAEEECIAMIDPVQFDQVIANLCINARDAINGPGKIELTLGRKSISHYPSLPLMPEGDYSCLSIKDNGSGISPENISKIYMPFFTTKEKGKGTGLGLATVYGIVKQNSAHIEVHSQPGHGTTFTIYFPIFREKQSVQSEDVKAELVRGNGELIMIVEDDHSILNLSGKILENLGYRVLPVDSPIKAVEIFQSSADNISLVISDVIMPEMNGKELIRQLKNRHPDLKCLLMTGYSSDILEKHDAIQEGMQIILKPFTMNVLAEKVKKALID